MIQLSDCEFSNPVLADGSPASLDLKLDLKDVWNFKNLTCTTTRQYATDSIVISDEVRPDTVFIGAALMFIMIFGTGLALYLFFRPEKTKKVEVKFPSKQ